MNGEYRIEELKNPSEGLRRDLKWRNQHIHRNIIFENKDPFIKEMKLTKFQNCLKSLNCSQK